MREVEREAMDANMVREVEREFEMEEMSWLYDYDIVIIQYVQRKNWRG